MWANMKCQGTKTSSQGRQDTLLTVEAAVADCLIFFISRVSALMNPTHLWSPDILCAEVLASVADRAAIGADFVVNLEFRWIFPPDHSDHDSPSFSTRSLFLTTALCWNRLFVLFSAIRSNAIVSECSSAAL